MREGQSGEFRVEVHVDRVRLDGCATANLLSS